MIVNSTPAGWQIIYQQAHALLAAQLAWHWPPTLPPDRWVGLLAAIAQHDDEQAAWRGRGGHHGLTRRRGPGQLHPTGFFDGAGRRGAGRRPLPGALAQPPHQPAPELPVRGPARPESPEIDLGFSTTSKPGSSSGAGPCKTTKKEAEQAYDLLHWCDRLSLILCRHEIPEMGRAVEIHRGPDGTVHTLASPRPAARSSSTPGRFRSPEIEVSVEASVLTQLQFRDDAALAAALRAAPVETLRWTLARA